MIIEVILVFGGGLACTVFVVWLWIDASRRQRYLKQQYRQSEIRQEQWKQHFDTLQTDDERMAAIDELLQDNN